MWVDNTVAIAVATGNDFTHETVKHVTLKARFLQGCVQQDPYDCVCQDQQKHCRHNDQAPGPQFLQHRHHALGAIDAITPMIADSKQDLSVREGKSEQRACERARARSERVRGQDRAAGSVRPRRNGRATGLGVIRKTNPSESEALQAKRV